MTADSRSRQIRRPIAVGRSSVPRPETGQLRDAREVDDAWDAPVPSPTRELSNPLSTYAQAAAEFGTGPELHSMPACFSPTFKKACIPVTTHLGSGLSPNLTTSQGVYGPPIDRCSGPNPCMHLTRDDLSSP